MKRILAWTLLAFVMVTVRPAKAQDPAALQNPLAAQEQAVGDPAAAAGADPADPTAVPVPTGPPPFKASLLLVKSDWSQMSAMDEIELRKVLRVFPVPTVLLDKLPESGAQILFPPEFVLRYSAEHYGELLSWLGAKGLLLSHYSFSQAIAEMSDPEPFRAPLSDPGKLPPGTYYAYHANLMLPNDMFDWPPLSSKPSQPFVTRESEWYWTVHYEDNGDERLYVERQLATVERARGQDPKRLASGDSSSFDIQKLTNGQVAVVNAFPGSGEAKFRESARRRGYEVLLVIERGAGTERGALDPAPRLVLPDEVTDEQPAPRLVLPDEVNTLKVARTKAHQWPGLLPETPQEPTVDAFAEGVDSPAASEVPEVRVFRLKGANAHTVEQTVRQLFGGEPAITVQLLEEGGSITLIVRGSPRAIKQIGELIKVIDRPAPVEDGSEAGARGAGGGITMLPGGSQVPSRDELARQYEALEEQAAELASRARDRQTRSQKLGGCVSCHSGGGARDQETRSQKLADQGILLGCVQAQNELRKVVAQAFAARQRLHQAELAELEQRLKTTRETLALRERVMDTIIERRVEELLDPNVNWDSLNAASSPGITVNQTSIPSVSTDLQESVPSQMVLGKTPQEFQDLLAQRADQVRQIQTSIRRWEGKFAEGSDVENAHGSIPSLEQQLKEFRRKQTLAHLEYREQIKLLEAVLERERARLAVAEEAMRFTERLHEKGYTSAQNLQQAQLKRKEAGVAVQRAESFLKMYQQAGAGLVPPSETDEDGAQTSAHPLAWDLLGMKLAEHAPIGRYRGGVVIRELRNQGAAAKAELRVGDVLVGLDRWETKSLADIGLALEHADVRPQPGQTKDVKAYLVRGDETFWAMLTLAVPIRPGDPIVAPRTLEAEQGSMGIFPATDQKSF